jgi:predicted amidohydrolase YtcJ
VADLAEPTKAELNEWAPANPVVVQLFSFHSAYVNSAAVRACGLDQAIAVPGGQIKCDPAGEAWKLQEAAVGVAQRIFFQSCGDERTLRELDRWLWTYAAAGYTASSEIGLRQGWADHYRAYLSRFKSPIRVRGYESCRFGVPPAAERNDGNHLFKVIGMKILADGSFFVGNVSLTCPYCDSAAVARLGIPPGPAHHTNWTREQLDSLIDGYASQGWQIAVHAQGDATTDLVLDCFERALNRYPHADRPFRIEHCSLMRRDQIDRAISLGVVGSFFTALFFEWGEVIQSDFFGDRGEPYLPSGTAHRRGMRVSYHCDSPMVWPDALQCVQFGVTRRTRKGNVIEDREGVGIDAALRAVTIDAAYHLQMDKEVGSLVPGKLADLVVLERDPRRSDPNAIAGIRVIGTYLGGESVSKRSV